MKTDKLIPVLAACAWLAGCVSTRPISDSGYREPRVTSGASPVPLLGGVRGGFVADGSSNPAFAYRGELSEFDLLGVAREQTIRRLSTPIR